MLKRGRSVHEALVSWRPRMQLNHERLRYQMGSDSNKTPSGPGPEGGGERSRVEEGVATVELGR